LQYQSGYEVCSSDPTTVLTAKEKYEVAKETGTPSMHHWDTGSVFLPYVDVGEM
jgi:hypothetical protein